MKKEISLYKKISNEISEKIDSGQLKSGDKIPSVAEIKSIYGVSQRTALSVFKELASKGYIQKEDGTGYYVTLPCHHESNGGPGNGLLACFLRPLIGYNDVDIYYNRIHYGIQKVLFSTDYNIVYTSASTSLEALQPPVKSLDAILLEMQKLSENVDGFIIDERIPDYILEEACKKNFKPMVVVNRKSSISLIDSVTPNPEKGINEAVNVSIKMGYNYFILVSGKRFFDRDDRSSLYNACLQKNSIKNKQIQIIECHNEYISETVKKLANTSSELLASGLKPMVFCTDDMMARDLCALMTNSGIKTGKEAGIVGFGGILLSDNNSPRLATIKTHPEILGEIAAKTLLNRINFNMESVKESPRNWNSKVDFSFGETV